MKSWGPQGGHQNTFPFPGARRESHRLRAAGRGILRFLSGPLEKGRYLDYPPKFIEFRGSETTRARRPPPALGRRELSAWHGRGQDFCAGQHFAATQNDV